MRIGFNFTLGETLPLVRQLAQEGAIDYCELLIDNFMQVPPRELAEAFDVPVGFHIMFSRFIESDEEQLRDFAARLRPYIEALRPLYVSDHIAYFSHQGRTLFHLGEIDYAADYERVRARAVLWQSLLGQTIHFENYPSIVDGGHAAPAFFQRLARDTGAGVLFDVSNAVCAWRNDGPEVAAWRGVMAGASHFHVGGYAGAFIDEGVTVDTHDRALALDTLDSLRRHRDVLDKPGATITYERDENIDIDGVRADLLALRAIFPRGQAHQPAPAEAAAS
jgi:methanobactin biosynthesis cassette protein MbnB